MLEDMQSLNFCRNRTTTEEIVEQFHDGLLSVTMVLTKSKVPVDCVVREPKQRNR